MVATEVNGNRWRNKDICEQGHRVVFSAQLNGINSLFIVHSQPIDFQLYIMTFKFSFLSELFFVPSPFVYGQGVCDDIVQFG